MKKYTQEEINNLIEVVDGIKTIQNINFRHSDLSGLVLRDIHFKDCNLCCTSLCTTDLSGVKLTNTHLCNANLLQANLNQACLVDVDLLGAWLDTAHLIDANLSNAKLIDVYLGDADLSRANLSNAKLMCANLNAANLSSANLSGASLAFTSLQGANLNGVNLSDTDMCATIGNKTHIKSMQLETYNITYTYSRLQINRKNYTHEEWKDFSDDTISTMGCGMLEWWKKWKEVIFNIIRMSPCKSTDEKITDEDWFEQMICRN